VSRLLSVRRRSSIEGEWGGAFSTFAAEIAKGEMETRFPKPMIFSSWIAPRRESFRMRRKAHAESESVNPKGEPMRRSAALSRKILFDLRGFSIRSWLRIVPKRADSSCLSRWGASWRDVRLEQGQEPRRKCNSFLTLVSESFAPQGPPRETPPMADFLETGKEKLPPSR